MAVEDVPSLAPATHVYACWEGWSVDSKAALGGLFLSSPTAMYLVVIQKGNRPGFKDAAKALEELGFGSLEALHIDGGIPVKLAGGGTQLRAYCFKRMCVTCPLRNKGDHLFHLPEMDSCDIEDVLIVADKLRKACESFHTAMRHYNEAVNSDSKAFRQPFSLSLHRLAQESSSLALQATDVAGKAGGGALFTCNQRALRAVQHSKEVLSLHKALLSEMEL